MNNYKFSAKTNSFYPESLLEFYEEAGTLPDDLLGVSDETYSIFSGQPPKGKVRGSKKGLPLWIDIPLPSQEQLQEFAAMKKQQLLDASNASIMLLERAVKLDMATDKEKTQLEAWEHYSVLLYRVDTSQSGDIEWPQAPEGNTNG